MEGFPLPMRILFFEYSNIFSAEDGRLLCGLDSTELEQECVLEVVNELERETYNLVVSSGLSGSSASKDDLMGLWDLIYSA
jgi:hypothetical protein